MSPRLHRRGRIEAGNHSAAGNPAASCLHAFTGVAELKHGVLFHPLRVQRGRLHAFTGVAELKRHDVLPERGDGRPRLHAFTGVAELKRGAGHPGSRPFSLVSTPSPAWPN